MNDDFDEIELFRKSSQFVGIILMIVLLVIHGVSLLEDGSNFWWVHLCAIILFIILFIWMAENPYIRFKSLDIHINKAPFSKKKLKLTKLDSIELINPNTSSPIIKLFFTDEQSLEIAIGPLSKNGRQKLLNKLNTLNSQID